MSISGETFEGRERVERASLRLRQPQRRQVVVTVTCPHGLVSATHPVRLLQAVVGRLDLKQFYEPIQARWGVAGRVCPLTQFHRGKGGIARSSTAPLSGCPQPALRATEGCRKWPPK
jgi:hypothetical protein